MLISTMRIENGTLPVIPVRTTKEIPKEKLIRAIKVDNYCKAPIKMGKVVIKNIIETKIDVVTSRSMNSNIDEGKITLKYDANSLKDTLNYTLRESLFGGSSALSDDNKLKLEIFFLIFFLFLIFYNFCIYIYIHIICYIIL